MPIPNIQQEELIVIDDNLRLRAYDGQFELALDWYQDPDMIYMIDGRRDPYPPERIQRMYKYLARQGEVYFIEVWERTVFQIFEVNRTGGKSELNDT